LGLLAELHDAVAAERSGVVWLAESQGSRPSLRLELVLGWVHAIATLRRDADDDERLSALRARPPLDAETTLVSEIIARLTGTAHLPQDESRQRLGAVTPFHPMRALRRAAAAVLELIDDDAAIDAQLRGRLTLGTRVHGSGLDPDERSLYSLLSSTQLSIEQLLARVRCTPPRAFALLRELALLGAITNDDRPIVYDLTALRAAAEARAAERRHAYHAAARGVHPDLNPDEDEQARAQRNAEMAALADRYRRGG
jgi:hypothetical protein